MDRRTHGQVDTRHFTHVTNDCVFTNGYMPADKTRGPWIHLTPIRKKKSKKKKHTSFNWQTSKPPVCWELNLNWQGTGDGAVGITTRVSKKIHFSFVLSTRGLLLWKRLDVALASSSSLPHRSHGLDEGDHECHDEEEDEEGEQPRPGAVGQGLQDGGALCWQEAGQGEHVAQGPAHWGVPCLGGNRPALSMLFNNYPSRSKGLLSHTPWGQEG